MTAKLTIQSICAAFACLCSFDAAIADSMQSDCDVVTLTGVGTRLADGTIVGTETLTVGATGEEIPVEFTAVPLGVTSFEEGQATFITSHDFKASGDCDVRFTTFDELKTIALEKDPACEKGACGLVFTLVLKKGEGRYTCGQIVSGLDPGSASFTSTLKGDTLQLNSVGKLCNCRPHRHH